MDGLTNRAHWLFTTEPKFEAKMNNFYVTLPSNTYNTRNNTTDSFRVKLAYSLELEGEWECALAAIQYPHTFENLTGQYFTCFFPNIPPMQVNIPSANYESIQQIITSINQAFQQAIMHTPVINNTAAENEEFDYFRDAFDVKYDLPIKRVSLTVRNIDIVLSEHLQYTLGYSADLAYFRDAQYTADFPPDITGGFTSLYVYVDIIKAQLVGDILTPLLRIVPIKGKYGRTIVNDYSKLHYVELLNKRFDSIEVSIKNDNNQAVRFM